MSQRNWHMGGCCLVTKSCLTLCNPMDCSPPGSSVHRTSKARILEWVTISFSRVFSSFRDRTHLFCIGRWVLYHWATREPPPRRPPKVLELTSYGCNEAWAPSLPWESVRVRWSRCVKVSRTMPIVQQGPREFHFLVRYLGSFAEVKTAFVFRELRTQPVL